MGRLVRRVGWLRKYLKLSATNLRQMTVLRMDKNLADYDGPNKFRTRVSGPFRSPATNTRNDFTWTQLKTAISHCYSVHRCCSNKWLLVYTDFNLRRAINCAKIEVKLIDRHATKIRRSSPPFRIYQIDGNLNI